MNEEPSAPGRPASIRLVRVSVPLRTAHAAAHGTEASRDVVLVEWRRRDGVSGWGECPTLSVPGYVAGTTEHAWRLLVDELAPAAAGGGEQLEDAAPGWSEEESAAARTALAALADARLDAWLRAQGRALGEHLGASPDPVSRCVVLAALHDAPEELARRAHDAVRGGASLVKVKIAPGRDVELLGAVTAAVGAARTAADANGSYPDPRALAEVDEMGLRYLEQPFDPGLDWGDAAKLHRVLSTPVALDEPLISVGALDAALDAGAASVVSVKPARLGGVAAAATAIARAHAAGVDVFVGGMLELGIGRAGAVAVAGLTGCTLPTDLGPSHQYVDTDVCAPIDTDAQGRLVPPLGPGIGRTPDEDVLERVATDEVTLTG